MIKKRIPVEITRLSALLITMPMDLNEYRFQPWSAHITEVEDEHGERGTIIYVPNVSKDQLFR